MYNVWRSELEGTDWVYKFSPVPLGLSLPVQQDGSMNMRGVQAMVGTAQLCLRPGSSVWVYLITRDHTVEEEHCRTNAFSLVVSVYHPNTEINKSLLFIEYVTITLLLGPSLGP